MPGGHLSLITIGRRDQRRMRKIAISSQLLCHFIRDKASVGHTCRAHFSISLTLREAFGPTSQDLSYRSPLSARARRRSPAAARISPQCSLAPSTNTDFTIPDHRRPTDRSTSTVIPSLLMWHTPPIRVGPRLPSSFQTLLWTPSFPDFALLHFLAFQFSPRHRCATVTLSQFAGRAEGLARPALAGLERLASSDKGPSTNKRRNGITCILWVLSTVHCSTFFMAEVATQMALGDIERLLLCTNIFYLACL